MAHYCGDVARITDTDPADSQAGRGLTAEQEPPVRIAAWTPPGFFDAAAGLPPSPEAAQWLAAGWRNAWADPVGRHEWAARSRAVLDESRSRFARFLGCSASEVWFAPNADAALATAVTAIAAGRADSAHPVVVTAVERLSVLRAVDALPAGTPVVTLGVSEHGRLDPAAPQLRGPARLIALQAANREIGTRQPVAEAAEVADPGAVLLVDASAVRCRADLPKRWDCIVLDPAMWGGPAGVAVLACRSTAPWTPAPPATSPDRFPGRVPAPLAAAAAMTLPAEEQDAEERRIRALGDWFGARVRATIPDAAVLGPDRDRLAHIVSLSLLYVNAEQLVDELDRRGFAVHSGSACTSDTRRPSHVLTAIGALTHGNLRVSLPPGCTAEDLRALADALAELVAAQRIEAGVA